ncbi:MAG: hypothetical protein ACLRZ3_11380 [Flavonifractor plautii]
MESLEALLELLTPLARLGRPALAAIDGRCGSGRAPWPDWRPTGWAAPCSTWTIFPSACPAYTGALCRSWRQRPL